MHYPKLFSPKFLLTRLLAALFIVSLGALPVQAQPDQAGLVGNYYNGREFQMLVFQRVDEIIDFSWPLEKPPASNSEILNQYNYSIRWNGYLSAPDSSGRKVIFRTFSDDGVKLWVYPIDSSKPDPIINNWTLHALQINDSAPQSLASGSLYNMQLDYFNGVGAGTIKLMYYFEGDDPQTAKIFPATSLFFRQ